MACGMAEYGEPFSTESILMALLIVVPFDGKITTGAARQM